jgi:8-oxo-dGTP pyrophosphatase MutT (NUDIX family)
VSLDPRAAVLLAALDGVEPIDPTERSDLRATAALLRGCARPFDADAQRDHVTASAFVVSPLGVVLLRHRRLGIWVQPGGHVDAGESPDQAALRELVEETGVRARHLEPVTLAHVSVHEGPMGHRHFDCRWLVAATTTAIAPQAGESGEVRWFTPDAALSRCAPDLTAGLAKALRDAQRLELPEVASWPP